MDGFGFLSGNAFTLNAARYVTRSHMACGLPMALSFAPATNLFECYDWTNDWRRATLCMYMQVRWFAPPPSSIHQIIMHILAFHSLSLSLHNTHTHTHTV